MLQQGCNSTNFPQTAKEWDARACEKYEREEYEKAVNDWDYAVRLDPNNDLYYWRRARACRQFGRVGQSIDDASKAVETAYSEYQKNKQDQRLKRRLMYYLDTRAVCYTKQGVYESALQDFNDAIELSGGGLEAAPLYMDRGRLYLAMEDTEKAIKDFNKAIEIVPTWGRAYHFRAKAYFLRKDFENTRKDNDLAGNMIFEEAEDHYEPLPITTVF